MRFFIFLFVALALFASIDTKIKRSKSALISTKKEIKGVNLELSKLAAQIGQLQKSLQTIDTKLANLQKNIDQLRKSYVAKEKEYQELQKKIETLLQNNKTLKQRLTLMVSDLFSKSLLLTSLKNPTPEDIYAEEILKALQRSEEQKLKKLSKHYGSSLEELQKNQKRLKQLQKELASLLGRQKELLELKKKKARQLKLLAQKKKSYDKKLKALAQQQKTLLQTLQRLNILKQKRNATTKVRKYGKMRSGRTVHYRGPKTIPPLRRFKIIKKYGYYEDPIYHIKIPNENIELKPLTPNAKVYNVLNGKVVLAKWTPHLKNVVIIQHAHGLYTIYAYLDKISPLIKPGKRIRKGVVIGRVSTKLIFEVTKNSAHINPLELIQLR